MANIPFTFPTILSRNYRHPMIASVNVIKDNVQYEWLLAATNRSVPTSGKVNINKGEWDVLFEASWTL